MEGLEYLTDEAQWPETKINLDLHEPSNSEKRTAIRTHATLATDEEDVILNRFSDLKRLLRVTAWIRRFVANCRVAEHNKRNSGTMLSRGEIVASAVL